MGFPQSFPQSQLQPRTLSCFGLQRKLAQHPQRPAGPPTPGKWGEQRGAGTPLHSHAPGDMFGMRPVLRVSPSKAYSGCGRRAEGYPSRHAPCPQYLSRVCPVPGGDMDRAACPAPWDLHTHTGDSPGTEGAHASGACLGVRSVLDRWLGEGKGNRSRCGALRGV